MPRTELDKATEPTGETAKGGGEAATPVKHPVLAELAGRGVREPEAIARVLEERGVQLDHGLITELHGSIGNAGVGKVVAAMQAKPKAEPVVAETPPVAVERGGGEPTTPPAMAQATVTVAPDVVREVAPTTPVAAEAGPLLCPAPPLVHAEVAATLTALGFAVAGNKLPIRVHSAPVATTTGFSFTNSKVGDDGRAASSTKLDTDYRSGMEKQHATGALAGADDVTLNPAADFTTLIHETVHLFQKGEIGRYLVEPMTEIIAAMAFTRLAGKGAVKGTYNYAAEYLPWVVFVNEVVAPKIGWPRLFGYYVGQGMKNFDELSAELGFRPTAAPMKALKEALANGDVAKAEKQRTAILAGPGKNEGARGFDAPGAALEGEHEMSTFETWLPTFGAVIKAEQKTGESNAATASRLGLENKRSVIEGALVEARKHLTTAAPTLQGEIRSFIADYAGALEQLA